MMYGMGRDRLLPHRIFGYIHPRLGTPLYSILLLAGIQLCGALFFKFGEAAEIVNFGAFIGFMAVNASVIWHYFGHLQKRKGISFYLNFVFPLLGFAFCFYIWLNLSGSSLRMGTLWMLFGLIYLAFLTRGFKNKLAGLSW
jgi:putrescine importer